MLLYHRQEEYNTLLTFSENEHSGKEQLLTSICDITYAIRKNMVVLYSGDIELSRLVSHTVCPDDEYSQKKYIFNLERRIQRMVYVRNILLYAFFEFPATENNGEHMQKIFGLHLGRMYEFITTLYNYCFLNNFCGLIDCEDASDLEEEEYLSDYIRYSKSELRITDRCHATDTFEFHTEFTSPDDVVFKKENAGLFTVNPDFVTAMIKYDDYTFAFDGLPEDIYRLIDNYGRETYNVNRPWYHRIDTEGKFSDYYYTPDDTWDYYDPQIHICDLINRIANSTLRIHEVHKHQTHGICKDYKPLHFDDDNLDLHVHTHSCNDFCWETIRLVNIRNRYRHIALDRRYDRVDLDDIDFELIEREFQRNIPLYYEQYRQVREDCLNELIHILQTYTETDYHVMSDEEAVEFKNIIVNDYDDSCATVLRDLIERVKLQFNIDEENFKDAIRGYRKYEYHEEKDGEVWYSREYWDEYDDSDMWDIDHIDSVEGVKDCFEDWVSSISNNNWEWNEKNCQSIYNLLNLITEYAKQDVSLIEKFFNNMGLISENPALDPDCVYEEKCWEDEDGLTSRQEWVIEDRLEYTEEQKEAKRKEREQEEQQEKKEPYRHPDYRKPASAADPIRSVEYIDILKDYFLTVGKPKSRKRNHAIFCLGISTGLRASDLLVLKVKDVYRDGHIVDDVVIREKKTDKISSSHLNGEIKSILSEYVDGLENKDGDAYLFPAKSYLGHLQVVSLYDIFQKAQKDLSLPFHFSTHSLRKTFAYWTIRMHYYDQNIIFSLQDMLNHRDIKNTLYYSGHTKDHLKTLYNDMGKVLNGSVENTPAISSQEQKINQILEMLSKQTQGSSDE